MVILEQLVASALCFGFGGMLLFLGLDWLDFMARLSGIGREEMVLGGMLIVFGAVFIVPGVMILAQ